MKRTSKRDAVREMQSEMQQERCSGSSATDLSKDAKQMKQSEKIRNNSHKEGILLIEYNTFKTFPALTPADHPYSSRFYTESFRYMP